MAIWNLLGHYSPYGFWQHRATAQERDVQGFADCHLLQRETLKTAQLLLQILSRCSTKEKTSPACREMCLPLPPNLAHSSYWPHGRGLDGLKFSQMRTFLALPWAFKSYQVNLPGQCNEWLPELHLEQTKASSTGRIFTVLNVRYKSSCVIFDHSVGSSLLISPTTV